MRALRTACSPALLLVLWTAMPAYGQVPDRAGELHQQALEILSRAGNDSPEASRAAARLHLRSAALRTLDDPQAEGCITVAVHLLRGLDRTRASSLLEILTQRAGARGDPAAASSAYLDAARLMISQPQRTSREAQRARVLLEHAQRSADASEQPAAERVRVTAQIRHLRTFLDVQDL